MTWPPRRGRGFFSWPFGRNNSQRSVREKIISHPLHPPGAFPPGQYPYAQRAGNDINYHPGPSAGVIPAAEGKGPGSSGERSPSFTFDPSLFRVSPAVANPVELPELVAPEQPGPPEGFLLVTKTIRRDDVMRQGCATLGFIRCTPDPSHIVSLVAADWLDEHRVKVITPAVKRYLIAWGEEHDPFIADLVRTAPEDLTEYTFNYLVPEEHLRDNWSTLMKGPLRDLTSLTQVLRGPDQDRAMQIGDRLAACVRLLEKHEAYVLKGAEATKRHLAQGRYPWTTTGLRAQRSVDSFECLFDRFGGDAGGRYVMRSDVEFTRCRARMRMGYKIQTLVDMLTEQLGEMDAELVDHLKKIIDSLGADVANMVDFDPRNCMERRGYLTEDLAKSLAYNDNDAGASSDDAKESNDNGARASSDSDAQASSDSDAQASSGSDTLGGEAEAEASPAVAAMGFI